MINKRSETWYAVKYDCPEYPDLHGKLHEISAGFTTTDCPYCMTQRDAGYPCPQLVSAQYLAEQVARSLVKREGDGLIDVHPKVVKVRIVEVDE